MRARGLALIELLIGSALLVVVIATGYEVLRGTLSKMARGRSAASSIDVETAFALMARDLRCAVLEEDQEPTMFAGRRDGRFSKVDFHCRAGTDGEVVSVAYAVAPGKLLVERRSFRSGAGASGDGHVAELCEAEAFDVQFLDGDVWRDNWGWNPTEARPMRGIRGLPPVVSIRLAVRNGTDVTEFRRILPVMTSLLNGSVNVR